MGKYRTFSSDSNQLCSLDDELLDPPVSPLHRDAIFWNCVTHSSQRILSVPGENKWSKWKRRSRRGSLHRGCFNLGLLVLGYLLLCQPCSSSPVESVTGSLTPQEQKGKSTSLEYASPRPEYITFHTEKPNCTPPSSEQFPADLFTKTQRQNGGILVHFLVLFYVLYALLLCVDLYFVPSVECICEELHIPHNITGATFMAVSTSAPELFTNVISTFVVKTGSSLGVGTIMGSAIFNILAVGSCVGIGTHFAVQNSPTGRRTERKGIPLEWWPLTRDSGFYLISVGALVGVLYDGRVYWYEALVLLVLYGFYIAGMYYDTQLEQWFETCIEKTKRCFRMQQTPGKKFSSALRQIAEETENEESALLYNGSVDKSYGSRTPLCNDKKSNSFSTQSKKGSISLTLSGQVDTIEDSSSSSNGSSATQDSTSSTTGILEGIKDIIAFPIRFLLMCTIPDCRKPTYRKWYAVTLVCCVVWIGGLTYLITWMVSIIGETLSIPDSISGLTVLAAGTSLPEVVSSVIVARQGFGSMGLSNSIGSNSFDVLVCLGLPWLIEAIILAFEDSNYIEIHSNGLELSAILLISSMIMLYVIIVMNGYVLDMKIGLTCVAMYAIFITVACLLEMNVFFPVNLPTC